MQKPFVSVIIPTYKGDWTLKRAVDSVLGQDYPNFEVIVVDDNDPSSEFRAQTIEMMKEYEQASNLIYVRHEVNKNGAAARNTGFKQSKGDYICLLDDDDTFLQGKIRKQVEFLENHPDFGGAYCWRMFNGEVIGSTLEGDLSEPLLDISFSPTTPSLMIRRECYEALNGFDESYRRHQDYEFLLRFFEKYSLGVVPEALIEIFGNAINNMPKGKQFYELKRQFFSQFEAKIEELERKNPGFKKRMYTQHIGRAFKDCIRYGNFIYAIRFYFKYGIYCGLDFWRFFIKLCKGGLSERMQKNT